MTRWTPFTVYLVVLAYTTALVISAGTFAFQLWSEWPTIRNRPNSTAPHSKPRPTTPSHNASPVKPGHLEDAESKSGPTRGIRPAALKPKAIQRLQGTFHAHSSLISMVGAIPGANNLPFFALDGRQDSRGGEHGVRRVPARKLLSFGLRGFTETGRGPSLELIVRGSAGLCGVDPDLGWSMAMRESSGRHWDSSGAVLTSTSGAVGVLQIKPSTARDVAANLDVYQPFGNSVAALCHFRRLLDKARGDRHLALRWYHRGEYAKGPAPKASHDYANDIIEGSN